MNIERKRLIQTKHQSRKHSFMTICGLIVSAGFFGINTTSSFAEIAVTSDKVIIGGVMDLEGRSRGLGQGMKRGITAAIDGVKVKGRSIEYVTLNDSYTPDKTIAATKDLANRGIFAMVGNVGTPTAAVSLPILAENKIPAVGFFTGAGLLRPGVGDVLNYRASYVQETAAVIDNAIESGVKPNEVCAYVQNDAYGMAGVAGIKAALSRRGGSSEIVGLLDEIMAMGGTNPPRNDIGPIGVYTRNTFTSRDGYLSLKNWEKNNNTKCRVVLTVGTYNAIARFAGYSKMNGDDWIFSAVSFTGADNLKNALSEFGIADKMIVTQVVPSFDSNLPIVEEARNALKDDFGYVTFEGYIVGKMFIEILKSIPGDAVTRENFLAAARDHKFNIGGLKLDFSESNQASDLVTVTYLNKGEYKIVSLNEMKSIFRN